MQSESVATIVIPCGPGAAEILDTLDSIVHYCPEPHDVIIVDDCTADGTYDLIMAVKKPNWHVLRNDKRHGINRLVHSLCVAYQYFLENMSSNLIFRLDQDALLIGSGVLTDALNFVSKNPSVGLFGVYKVDYNRPRSFTVHKQLIDKEASWLRRIVRIQPSWLKLLQTAEERGYRRGDNVFGGAYFITRECLARIRALGGLQVPYNWHSRIQEDVYFSMATVAADFEMGHFAAPNGPLCLEWRGLPYPAMELQKRKYKVIHSVDKGKNTGSLDNNGLTAREIFKEARKNTV